MNPYVIRKDNLASFAYTNEPLLQQPPKAVALDFHGLNMNQMLQEHSEKARLYAQRGLLLVVPYDNPWSWMNSVAVAETDAIVDAVYAKLSLSDRVPLLSTGGSMGGLSALVFSARSARPVAGCAANCPVCDLPYHYTERPDLPRTILSAFWHEGDIERPSSPPLPCTWWPSCRASLLHRARNRGQAVNLQRHSCPWWRPCAAAGWTCALRPWRAWSTAPCRRKRRSATTASSSPLPAEASRGIDEAFRL